jgi:hypothetical protein
MRPLTFRNKLLLACAVAVAVVAGGLVAVWPREPVFEGKPLSYWLDQLSPTMPMTPHGTHFLKIGTFGIEGQRIQFSNNAALHAIDSLGSRCLPTLVDRLRIGENRWTRLRRQLRLWAKPLRASFAKPDYFWLLRDIKRGQAVTALTHLGDAAHPVLPELVAIAKSDSDPAIRASALEVLRHISSADYAQITGQTNVVSAAATSTTKQ